MVVDMPLNKDGDGPAKFGNMTEMTWEVWFVYTNQTVASFHTKTEAENCAKNLNHIWSHEK